MACTPVTRFQEPVAIRILEGSNFSSESGPGLHALLSRLFEQADIQRCEEHNLSFIGQEAKKRLLVLPGSGSQGISSWALSPEQQDTIEKACKVGLLQVLGVCAGGYYPSDTIRFNGEVRIHPHRRLRLFPGECSGPFFVQACPQGLNMQVGQVNVLGNKFNVILHQGGQFVPYPELQIGQDYEVLARYETGDIAAVACVPQGKASSYNAVLIGPHFEYEPNNFYGLASIRPKCQEVLYEMAEKVASSAQERFASMRYFLSRMGFK